MRPSRGVSSPSLRSGCCRYVYAACAPSCLTLCNPVDCSTPGPSVHGISQARILEWLAISFSRGSSWPRDQTQVYHIAGRFITTEPPGIPDIVDGSFPKGPEFFLHDTPEITCSVSVFPARLSFSKAGTMVILSIMLWPSTVQALNEQLITDLWAVISGKLWEVCHRERWKSLWFTKRRKGRF